MPPTHFRLPRLVRIGHFAALGAEAVVQIAAVWLEVRLLPSRRWRRRIDSRPGLMEPPLGLARDLRRLMSFIAPALPQRTRCLVCALAARAVLARRGYGSALSLGANIGEDELTAHAWLTAASIVVTGRETMGDYQEVARF